MQNKRLGILRLPTLLLAGACMALCMGVMPAVAKKPQARKAKAKKAVKSAKRTTKAWKALKRKARRKGRTIIIKKDIDVKGTKHKPEAVYFLYRSKMQYNKLKRRRNYLGKVIRSVRAKPF